MNNRNDYCKVSLAHREVFKKKEAKYFDYSFDNQPWAWSYGGPSGRGITSLP